MSLTWAVLGVFAVMLIIAFAFDVRKRGGIRRSSSPRRVSGDRGAALRAERIRSARLDASSGVPGGLTKGSAVLGRPDRRLAAGERSLPVATIGAALASTAAAGASSTSSDPPAGGL